MKNDWIVVVDDDEVSLQNARNLLQENNMRVSTVNSGRELLSLVEKEAPDLILLDILMPELDGFETYRLLREYEERSGHRETPVIFLTGENNSTAERRGLSMGASDFVRKPFNRDILMRRIRNTIQNSRTIESLTEEATIDKLTGFLNKASTDAKMPELCRDGPGVLAIFDLDSFKLVNDLFGHDMGDRVLKTFASIVRRNTRAGDVRCRIGGDEFLVFLRCEAEEKTVAELTKRLNEQFVSECKSMMGEDFGIPVGVSVGAAPVPEQDGEFDQIFRLADKALYHAKQNGKHSYAMYDTELRTESRRTEAESLDRELARITQIMEERSGGTKAAMWLGQEAFATVYRFVVRSLKQSGEVAAKLLFQVSAKDGGNENGLSDTAIEFGAVLSRTLRAKDVIFQSRPTQFFVLLPGQSQQRAEETAALVMEEWRKIACHDLFHVAYAMEMLRFDSEGESDGDERLKSIPGLRYDEGLAYCGSQAAYHGLLDVFRQSALQNADTIERCWRSGDLKNYTIKVHALKSAARTVGARELSGLAKELEKAGNAGNTEQIDEKTPELLKKYRALEEILRSVFESGKDSDRPPIDESTLKAAYAAIAECAAMRDYDMMESTLSSLDGYRLTAEDAERLKTIRTAMMELDWERIAALGKNGG